MAKAKQKKDLTPDLRPITESQAQRLAAMTEVDEKEVVGLSVAEISEKFKFRIDPKLLCFRRICGQVVKTDPDTGVQYPVPFATVHVEDTDCNLLGFFPIGWPWGWFLPISCQREVIATAVTDACGRFCVYVPCWEVDWILRWRHDRICFPDIFYKPTFRDFLEELLPEPPVIRWPRPEPDPVPFRVLDDGLVMQRIGQLTGTDLAGEVAAINSMAALGAPSKPQEQLLNKPAFSDPLPPPLPSEVQRMVGEKDTKALATHLNVEAKLVERFEPRRFIGPFRRCIDVFFPEWQAISDVPDITFRVTQDVDNDGDEETIYAEGFFDVRWNAGNIPDVTLEASPIAVASVACDTPSVPCEDEPAILFAGLMPLVNPAGPADPYHDASTGYGRRPNRPHASGRIAPIASDLPLGLAEAPYTGHLQLYGCNELESAAYYRILYEFDGSAPVPFTGLTWPLHRVVSGSLQSHWPTADANGWYPVIPAADGWHPNRLLLNWPTGSYANGHYNLVLQLGNSSKAVINTPDPVSFHIDNSRPTVQFTELRWRVASGVWSDPLSLICPVVNRPVVGSTPVDLEFQVSYQVAATHLRSVVLGGGGCGAGTPMLTSPLGTAQHWHTNPADNAVANTATFSLSGSADQGAYSFNVFAASRAFNPAGGDGGFAADWNYDPVKRWRHPRLSIAVVNS